jgi:uncharacterized protein YuzE
MLKISYDKEGDVLEIRFSENAIVDSKYIEESGLVIDYDRGGNIVAVEFISFSKRVGRDEAVEAIAI